MSWATTSSPGHGAAASTSRTTQPSSVVECSRAPRRAAVKVASPHWVGGNVLTKPNRMLIVQVPSDRTAPREPKTKPHAIRCSGSRAACMPDQPPRHARVPGADQEGSVPAAATAGLARRTKGATTSAYPKTGRPVTAAGVAYAENVAPDPGSCPREYRGSSAGSGFFVRSGRCPQGTGSGLIRGTGTPHRLRTAG